MVTSPVAGAESRPSWRRFVRIQGLSGSGLGQLIGGVVYAGATVTAVGIGLPIFLPQYAALITSAGVPLLVVLFAILTAFVVRSMRRGVLLQSWSESRGMRYVHQRRSRHRSAWPGSPFPHSGGYFVRHHVIGTDIETGRFRSLPDDSGYHSAGLLNSFTFVRFALPTSVPHLVVTSNRSSALSAAGLAISGGRVLRGSLEFDSSFTLHCPADYERDALYIFTPDLLALMLDAAPGCDLELIDDMAYLYVSREPKLWVGPVADELLAVVALLRRKLDRQTRRYTDVRLTEKIVSPGAPRVAVEGLRLANRRSMRSRAIAAALALPGMLLAASLVAQALGWISI
ncbi:hypothetical protein QCD70_14445 [Agreia sp. PsM10]|uniref:hypothetical protein n=1 Tax=Agreia sp. PsM10 TaxID=3030533 RepID=UPI00263B1549|nr:hypothetical protein [Agreia sp. PsM10]MDN4641451.1 hypothetical protein [Agreia sp. PsM10]